MNDDVVVAGGGGGGGDVVAPLGSEADLLHLLDHFNINNAILHLQTLRLFMLAPVERLNEFFVHAGRVSRVAKMLESPEEVVQACTLRVLWHLSAQSELKMRLFEDGVLDYLLPLARVQQDRGGYDKDSTLNDNDDEDEHMTQTMLTDAALAVTAIVQNISESKYGNGETNPNQVKIAHSGILETLLLPRASSKSKALQFLTCLTLANLSMTPLNVPFFAQTGALDLITKFTTQHEMTVDLVCHWLSLQPHIPLLASPHPPIQLFALCCLEAFLKDKQYSLHIWKALAMNDGVGYITKLAQSRDHPDIALLARKLASQLGVALPVVSAPPPAINRFDELFHSGAYSDFELECEGLCVRVHRALCSAASPGMRAMMTWGKDAQSGRAVMQGVDYKTLQAMLQYIYTGDVDLDCDTVVSVLAGADMYGMIDLKRKCEVMMWHLIDDDNAVSFYDAGERYQAEQLRELSWQYLLRNFDRISKEGNLSQAPKTFLDRVSEAHKLHQDYLHHHRNLHHHHPHHDHSNMMHNQATSTGGGDMMAGGGHE